MEVFTFQEIDNKEVARRFKSLDGRKSTGVDKIPPKLVPLAANELTNTFYHRQLTQPFEIRVFRMMQKSSSQPIR